MYFYKVLQNKKRYYIILQDFFFFSKSTNHTYLFFFLLEERLSCPESDSDSDSELEELELLELLEESELESEAWPELYKKGDRCSINTHYIKIYWTSWFTSKYWLYTLIQLLFLTFRYYMVFGISNPSEYYFWLEITCYIPLHITWPQNIFILFYCGLAAAFLYPLAYCSLNNV